MEMALVGKPVLFWFPTVVGIMVAGVKVLMVVTGAAGEGLTGWVTGVDSSVFDDPPNSLGGHGLGWMPAAWVSW